MANVTVEVHGTAELISGSMRLFKRIDDNARAQFGRVAGVAASAVRGRVPKVTGRLASSVTVVETQRSVLLKMGSGYPVNLYAGWIEFGGSRGRPRVARGRYLYPTAMASAPMATLAGEQAAIDEIRGFSWPSV